MNTISNANVRDYRVNGSWTIAGSMKPDGESAEVKGFILRVKFNNVPVEDIIRKALDPTKIAWVNAQGRKNFGKFTKNQTIDIDFKSPASAPQVSPQEQFKADMVAAGVDPTDKEAVLAFYETWITK